MLHPFFLVIVKNDTKRLFNAKKQFDTVQRVQTQTVLEQRRLEFQGLHLLRRQPQTVDHQLFDSYHHVVLRHIIRPFGRINGPPPAFGTHIKNSSAIGAMWQ